MQRWLLEIWTLDGYKVEGWYQTKFDARTKVREIVPLAWRISWRNDYGELITTSVS